MNIERRIKRLKKGTPVWVGTKRTPFTMGVVYTPAFSFMDAMYVTIQFIGRNLVNYPVNEISVRTTKSFEELTSELPRFSIRKFCWFKHTHYMYCDVAAKDAVVAAYAFEYGNVRIYKQGIDALVNDLLRTFYRDEFHLWDDIRFHVEEAVHAQIRRDVGLDYRRI